jgi:hypothetical protein
MQQQYMLYLADKAQDQFAEGVSPDKVDLHHTSAEIAPLLFPWLNEAHQHAQRTVRLRDTLAKLGYSRCFSDRAYQRMGLQHMAEKIPEGQQDDANMAGIEEDAMADDIDAQAQFYE